MRGINKQRLNVSAADVLLSREKLRKTSEGLKIPLPPPLVRPRVKKKRVCLFSKFMPIRTRPEKNTYLMTAFKIASQRQQ